MPIHVNPFEIWDELSPEQQRTFGAAGIVHMLGTLGAFSEQPSKAYEAAEFEGLELMISTLDNIYCPVNQLELRANTPIPDLAYIGLQTCRVCGCTNNYGCGEGCYWIEDNLCSACVGNSLEVLKETVCIESKLRDEADDIPRS